MRVRAERTALGDERTAEREDGPQEALGLHLREPEAVQPVVDVHAGAHEEDAHAADQRHDRRHLRVAVPARSTRAPALHMHERSHSSTHRILGAVHFIRRRPQPSTSTFSRNFHLNCMKNSDRRL